jgi:hypothetical protein
MTDFDALPFQHLSYISLSTVASCLQLSQVSRNFYPGGERVSSSFSGLSSSVLMLMYRYAFNTKR